MSAPIGYFINIHSFFFFFFCKSQRITKFRCFCVIKYHYWVNHREIGKNSTLKLTKNCESEYFAEDSWTSLFRWKFQGKTYVKLIKHLPQPTKSHSEAGKRFCRHVEICDRFANLNLWSAQRKIHWMPQIQRFRGIPVHKSLDEIFSEILWFTNFSPTAHKYLGEWFAVLFAGENFTAVSTHGLCKLAENNDLLQVSKYLKLGANHYFQRVYTSREWTLPWSFRQRIIQQIIHQDICAQLAKNLWTIIFLSSFADDTRVGHAIASKEDMTQLQTDLETVYCWAVRNNMEFNSDKFEFIRYSPTKSPLDTGNIQYYSNIGTPIQQQRHIRDLGVTISEDATFSQYISEKIATMKSKTGWVLRTFQTRDRRPMLTLWKSLILSEHDYCCQLWNPHRTGEVQSLEVLQHFFIKKISGVSHLSYWDQLSKLKMYSLERRRESYIAIYIWKILEGTVPNVGSDSNAITATWHARRGRECNIPKISTTAPTRIQNIRRASFTVNGPRIFNSLPQYIRDTTKCDKNIFKAHLDHYLQQVPDQPLIPGYTAYRMCDSNSLIDWSRNAQLKTQLEEPPRENSLEAGEEAVYSDLSQ